MKYDDIDGIYMTPEQARDIELPSFFQPVKRVREIRRIATLSYPRFHEGPPAFKSREFTRKALVKIAMDAQLLIKHAEIAYAPDSKDINTLYAASNPEGNMLSDQELQE